MDTSKSHENLVRAGVENATNIQTVKKGVKPETQNVNSSPPQSDLSAFSDSDATNLSSSGNSTWRSDLSGGQAKQGRTSKQQAIAMLDFFLNDVSEMTEKAKREEEKRLQSAKTEPPPTAKEFSLPSIENSNIEIHKRWRSLPSVVSEDGIFPFDTRLPKSFEDIRSIEYDVFSDEESIPSAHEQKKKIYAKKKFERADASISSQGSDFTGVPGYGITQLNHLCKFLEQFDQLKQQNSELSKLVSQLEVDSSRKESLATEVRPNSGNENASQSQRNSMIFTVPKERPKKAKTTKAKMPNSIQHHKDRIKGRTKYLASLPFVLAAKSVENIKHGSSQHLDRIGKSKSSQPQSKTLQHQYSVDDLEIGKTRHSSSEDWRNSSVKSPSAVKSVDTLFEAGIDGIKNTSTPTQEVKVVEETITPVVVVSEEASNPTPVTPQIPEITQKDTSEVSKKVFPAKVSPPYRSKSEERNYRNIKKMTEWGTLQQAFPIQQVESNVELLNQLETIISASSKHHHHHGKRSGHFKRPGRSLSKKEKHSSSSMYLPSTEVPGFASTFLAAHAMANQLTLALNMNDLEGLDPINPDEKPQTSMSNHPISIS